MSECCSEALTMAAVTFNTRKPYNDHGTCSGLTRTLPIPVSTTSGHGHKKKGGALSSLHVFSEILGVYEQAAGTRNHKPHIRNP